MKKPKLKKVSHGELGTLKRRTVSVSQGGLVGTGLLLPGQVLPLVVQPAVEGVNLVAWAAGHRTAIERKLLTYGAILFRGFDVTAVSEFEQFIEVFSEQLLEYDYQSTPRRPVSGRIYTSTEYPHHQSIPLHNEMSYASRWPMKVWFFCVQPAERGGETPLADSRRVFQRIDPKIKERFARKKVMYVRNYGNALDLPWQTVFQTASRSEVEDYCRQASIAFAWKNGEELRTRQVCQAVARHPETGQKVWFNQAHLFHVSNLQSEVREGLPAALQEEDFPRHAYYGDGAPIETSVLDDIREIYQEEAVIFPWQKADILMLDNMLTAHGRRPFVGPRRILVGMANPWSNRDEQPEGDESTRERRFIDSPR